MNVLLKKLNKDVSLTYATSGSAAMDLMASIPEPLVLYPQGSLKIPTGIALHIEDKKCAALILPRSGLGSKGIVLTNTVGLIDSDYQGEIMLSLVNRSTVPVTINPLDRVAQILFIPVVTPNLVEVSEFTPTDRGTGGFGSTG